MNEQQEAYWGPKLWEELRGKDPGKVCSRCAVEHDPSGFYSIESLGKTVRVFPDEERIETEDEYLSSSTDYQLFLVSYLLYAQNMTQTGEWVSEKDLKGGSTFFRGPHALPSDPVEKKYGEDPDGFRSKSETLGATKASFGDASMEFPAAPRISFIIVLWLKDDEFPARVTFMMDRSIEAHLPLDVISAMTVTVTQKLVRD